MSLIVQKFGGTSVANTERLKNVADIVTKTAQAGNQVVVVVSAQGDTTDDLIVKAAELNDRPSKRSPCLCWRWPSRSWAFRSYP